MTEKNIKTANVSDTAILECLISMLPFSIENILYTNKDDDDSLSIFIYLCLGLATRLGADAEELLSRAFGRFNLTQKDIDNMIASVIDGVKKSSFKDTDDLLANILSTINIEIPEDKKPAKRNDNELNNETIIKACTTMITYISDYGIALEKLNKTGEDAKETALRIKEDCQVVITFILGLIDKLGMKPEDAIAMAATKALVATEDGIDEHKLTEEEIDIINDEIADYLSYSLDECTNMVYDMLN